MNPFVRYTTSNTRKRTISDLEDEVTVLVSNPTIPNIKFVVQSNTKLNVVIEEYYRVTGAIYKMNMDYQHFKKHSLYIPGHEMVIIPVAKVKEETGSSSRTNLVELRHPRGNEVRVVEVGGADDVSSQTEMPKNNNVETSHDIIRRRSNEMSLKEINYGSEVSVKTLLSKDQDFVPIENSNATITLLFCFLAINE